MVFKGIIHLKSQILSLCSYIYVVLNLYDFPSVEHKKIYFEKSVNFFFFFHCNQNCFFTYILQNDVFCVLQNKISHTGLECMRVSEC